MPRQVVLSKEDIEQVFDGAAAAYDAAGPSIFAQFGGRLVQGIPLAPGSNVLDVATGKGAVLVAAAARVGPTGHLTGVDLSGGILREAEQVVAANGLTNVELRKMDAEHLEFPDGTFDVVTCAFALFMFPDMAPALGEMYRVCRPGGYLAVTYFNSTPPPFDPGWPVFAQLCTAYQVGMRMPQKLGLSPGELEALLSRAGFQIVETHSENNDLVYATGEDWWDFMMTLGSRATILRMSDDVRRRFKAEYLDRLLPACREDGLHMATAVIYSLAKR
jgi:O-methyltransferase/aklanonic acid methyltransferase